MLQQQAVLTWHSLHLDHQQRHLVSASHTPAPDLVCPVAAAHYAQVLCSGTGHLQYFGQIEYTANDTLANVTVLKNAYAAPSTIYTAYVLALEAEESCIGLRLQTHILVCELVAQSARALHTPPCSPPRTSGSLLELAATAAHLEYSHLLRVLVSTHSSTVCPAVLPTFG